MRQAAGTEKHQALKQGVIPDMQQAARKTEQCHLGVPQIEGDQSETETDENNRDIFDS